MYKVIICLCLFATSVIADDVITIEYLSTEPEVIGMAWYCYDQERITEAEMDKVMKLPLQNITLGSEDMCAELSEKLKPLKAWYE